MRETTGTQSTKRRLPRSLRRKIASGKPRGRPFPPGKNAHADDTFRRGRDLIPRGSIRLMYTSALNDDGALYREIKKDTSGAFRVVAMRSVFDAIRDRRLVMNVLETIGSRIEGKPIQQVQLHSRRVTFFSGPKETPPEDAPRSVVASVESAAPGIPPVAMVAVDVPPRPARGDRT